MNGLTEQNHQALEKAILDALTGLDVDVTEAFGHVVNRPLTREGAQLIIDRLRGRDFAVTRR